MPTNPSTPRNDQSIKLSVTVKSRLEGKYNPAALTQIKTAIEAWKKADAERGIHTVHVHVDDSAEMLRVWRDYFPKAPRVRPVSGKVTPLKIKRAIDDLWNKLTPDYLVLFGGEDIVPMFPVPNPVKDKKDTDKILPSDSPYATHVPFSRSDPYSCVVPERAIGRIPDMVSDPDPAWLLDYLDTATKWKSTDGSVYSDPYAICTAEAQRGATKFMREAFNKSGLRLFICPTDSDISPAVRGKLSAGGLHVIKCHGNNEKDGTFWGFLAWDILEQKHGLAALTSTTLRQLEHLEYPTVVASMCCYGADIFSPSGAKPPDTWPMASAYLRKGALGFVGSTRMAWVGSSDMNVADLIVQRYLKNVLAGASLGCAFLKSIQDYQSQYRPRLPNNSPLPKILVSTEQKTLIEYVLLGDPSIHPVSSSQSAVDKVAVPRRCRRRVARARIAKRIRDFLPTRSRATRAEKDMAEDVFKNAQSKIAKDDIKKFKEFGIKPTAVQVKRVDAPDPDRVQRRQSLEYCWCGQRDRGGQKQLCMLKAVTDRKGNLSRASVMYTS